MRASLRFPAFLPFFNFFFLSRRFLSFVFIIFTHAHFLRRLWYRTHHERRKQHANTHTHRKVRPRTPSRSFGFVYSFSSCFHSLSGREREERRERFDFDRKDEASSRLWQPPSLRFEFCGSLSSIEKFLTHTFFSLTRAKETASAEEREKEEEERKSRASNFIFLPSFIIFLQALLLRVFGDLFTNLSNSLHLSQKRQVYGKWTKSSNKREQNNFFVD